jgi:hypothetical protein
VSLTDIVLKKDYPCLNLVKGQTFENLLDKLESIACLSNTSNCDCPNVINLAVEYDQRGLNDITKYRVRLFWQPVATATSYIIQYKPSNSTIWQSAITTNITSYNGLILSNISLINDFRIKAVCNNCESGWTDSLNKIITTCDKPTNAYYDPVLNNLYWTSAPNQPSDTFTVEMRRDDQTTFTTINVNAVETPVGSGTYIASLNAINFSANYVYHFCIVNECGTTTTTYSDHGTGCAYDCAVPNQFNPTVGTITPTSAVISWVPIIGATDYLVSYTNGAIVNSITASVSPYTITGINTTIPTTVTVKVICSKVDNVSPCGGKSVTF